MRCLLSSSVAIAKKQHVLLGNAIERGGAQRFGDARFAARFAVSICDEHDDNVASRRGVLLQYAGQHVDFVVLMRNNQHHAPIRKQVVAVDLRHHIRGALRGDWPTDAQQQHDTDQQRTYRNQDCTHRLAV
ncbi:hypothetical protein SDC9_153958 [bioreactor metagenome]|uniref:Uncharacterized protein n=1 Tax=bioreactor metagenome TaxID=1076179 RepID=A0A645EZN0_9ZZZZ